MKLFTIRQVTHSSTRSDLFFASKPEAKIKRDELNGAKWADEDNCSRNYVVTRGPDHWLGLAGQVPQTRAGTTGGKRKTK